MAASDGVIQYRLDYQQGPLPAGIDVAPLLAWFQTCHELGLIGREPGRYGGYAFGNISQRTDPGFLISGTQTGGLPALTPDDLCWVQACETATNHLSASGPVKPSSEALTHGEVYATLPDVSAVIHVHAPTLWQAAAALGLPVTDPTATYGTPAMARAVRDLLIAQPTSGVLSMGGHEDGIIAYGPDLPTAGQLLLDAAARAPAQASGRDSP